MRPIRNLAADGTETPIADDLLKTCAGDWRPRPEPGHHLPLEPLMARPCGAKARASSAVIVRRIEPKPTRSTVEVCGDGRSWLSLLVSPTPTCRR